MSTETPPLISVSAFDTWLRTGERGLSSETIVSHLTGVAVTQRRSVPYDPADFRRCHLLLEAVPEARLAFDRMRTASPTWATLVDAWDELTGLWVEERNNPDGRAPRLYARMRKIVDATWTVSR